MVLHGFCAVILSVCVKVFPHPLWICLEMFLSVIVRLVDLLLYIVWQLMEVSNLCWSLVYGHLLVSYVLSICLWQLCILCFAVVLVPGITVFPPMGCNIACLVEFCINVSLSWPSVHVLLALMALFFRVPLLPMFKLQGSARDYG